MKGLINKKVSPLLFTYFNAISTIPLISGIVDVIEIQC